MSSAPRDETRRLEGKRIALFGRLASMPKREAARLLRQHGATVVDGPDASVHMVVVGEEDLPLGDGADPEELFDPPTREAAERGTLEVLTETQLWQRLGLVDIEQDIHRLYTPAMLADLLHVPVAVIRRWHRRGLIVPVREVRRLPYFDFQEVSVARRLAELLATGMSPAAIEKRLAALVRWLPGVQRPLTQLSIIIEGRNILLRQGDGLIEPGGQLRFDFEAVTKDAGPTNNPDRAGELPAGSILTLADAQTEIGPPATADEMLRFAAELEETGQLVPAVEMYRAAMAAEGPKPEVCFQVAELLYRLGDLGGARERYYVAIELDEDYVEARANLGCVLAETGQRDLAVAAFEGALVYHPGYADAHYHLARTLDELGRRDEAEVHWRAFRELAPESPWADQAHSRLEE
jgi:tetratricopeptide (TPR) repeat protein